MQTFTRGCQALLLALMMFTMQGCFTPAHVAGIEYADSLRREFAACNTPPSLGLWGLRLMSVPLAPAKGAWSGVAQREGALFDEYQFASILASEDKRRCLRVLLPVIAEGEGSHPAILEEFEGEPRGVRDAWLHIGISKHPGAGGESPFKVLREEEMTADAVEISLALESREVAWTRGPTTDRIIHHKAFEDRLHWRRRSGGEVILRVVTIPVALAGDAALAAGVVVVAPFLLVDQMIQSLKKD